MRQVVAFGGGGFSQESGNPLLDDYVLALTGTANPRVCFLPTASGDADHYLVRFYNTFRDRGRPSHVSLFRRERGVPDIRSHLLAQDLIYVGGGSMLNLLAVWDAHDLGAILRLAWERGILICGQSAGAMCWFEVGISRGSGKARRAAGLGVLPGSCCVHYHSEPDRRRLLLESVASSGLSGYGIDDHAALLWTDLTVGGAFSAHRGATAYRVERGADRVVEVPLAPTVVVPQAGDSAVPSDIAEFRRARTTAGRLAAGSR